MVSRSNVGAAQHIQIDRGTVIRTFRQMNARDIESTGCAAFRSRRGQDPVPQDDTNGKRYTQALDRLKNFKVQHKRRVWQDRRKADWQEENCHLHRASQELTKAIQDMLSTSKNSCRMIGLVWDGPVDKSPRNQTRLKHRQEISMACGLRGESSVSINMGSLARFTEHTNRATNTAGSPQLSREMADVKAEVQDIENTRDADIQIGVLHVRELRGIVSEFVRARTLKTRPSVSGFARQSQRQDHLLLDCQNLHDVGSTGVDTLLAEQDSSKELGTPKGNVTAGKYSPSSPLISQAEGPGMARVGSGAAFIAELLVQVRTAHKKTGENLTERRSVLEADLQKSKRVIAAVLASDYEESRSLIHHWVLTSIELGTEDERAQPQENRYGEIEKEKGRRGSDGETSMRVGMVQKKIVQIDVSDRLRVLEAEHSARLVALRDEFKRDASGPTAAGSIEAALDINGGWGADNQFKFMKVIKAVKGAVCVGSAGILGRPDRCGTLIKRLGAELPDFSAAEISKHEYWNRLRRLHIAKKRVEQQRHSQELEGLVAWGKESLEALRNNEAERAARADELKDQDRRRAELDDLLREQREVRERCNQEEQEREEKASRERVFRQEEEAEKKKEEDHRKRDAVAEYRASLQELRFREEKGRVAAAKAREAERVQRMPKNRERVGFREERSRQKREDNERRGREAETLEAMRLQVLEKLAASVPYAEACANAEAKLDHITAATAAHFDGFLHSDRSRGHCPMFGYDTKKVFRDARFRLGLYLREAGVSGSVAAHSAVMKAVGPYPDAPF